MGKTATKTLQRKLQDNIRHVGERITEACLRSQRDPASVRLIAVTKYVDIDVIRAALELGLTDIGESRVQELIKRASMIHESARRKRILGGQNDQQMPTWHMVGHLQRNKVRAVLQWSNIIHSTDSIRLAEEISFESQKLDRQVDIFLQVNVAGEKSKFGVAVGAVEVMVEQIRQLPNLRLVGLMTLAHLADDPQEVRPEFARLREISEDLKEQELVADHFRELSMGMSSDFEVAIEEGATMVRIGTALFEGLNSPTQ